jgi:hypothetical protein
MLLRMMDIGLRLPVACDGGGQFEMSKDLVAMCVSSKESHDNSGYLKLS